MKKIILSADDFARSHERNLAIDEAMRIGLIRSAALLVNSDHTREAIELAKAGGYLQELHCHLSLAYGDKISGNSKPLDSVFAACDTFCEEGEFRQPFYNKLDFWRYVDVTYRELKAQFLRFQELTLGEGNFCHVDVHIYNNRSYPFAVAYRRLIRKYRIKTARYYGVHHRTMQHPPKEAKRLFWSSIMCGHRAQVCRSCNVDYFLSRPEEFEQDQLLELYVHPDYMDGTDGLLMDNTESVFGHERKSLQEQLAELKAIDVQLISWRDLTNGRVLEHF